MKKITQLSSIFILLLYTLSLRTVCAEEIIIKEIFEDPAGIPETIPEVEESTPTIEPQIRIEHQEGTEIRNDFVLGPTRFIYDLEPGQEIWTEIQITNRMKNSTEFELHVEDFTSSLDTNNYTHFLGEGVGQFSSKTWFQLGTEKIILKFGERAYIPIKITVPKEVEPGDHYSAVFVQTAKEDDDANTTGITLTSRAGALFLFNTGKDKAVLNGFLQSFRTSNKIFTKPAINFLLTFKNEGNVHLIPSGRIVIKDIFGESVDELYIKDWVILRDSIRSRELTWEPKFAIGKYSAVLELDRGYDGKKDTQSITFFVIPAQTIYIILGAIALIAGLVFAFLSKFEIRVKPGKKKIEIVERDQITKLW